MAAEEPIRLVAREFMHRGVLKLRQDSKVDEAVKIMAENNVGSVVVLDDIGPCGVFTERDLLSKVLARRKDPKLTTIVDVKSYASPTVEATATPEAVASALIRKHSRLLVVEGTDLVGIITPTDILRAIQKLNRDFEIFRVVSKRIVTVPPETPTDAVVDEMNLKRIGSVVVVEGGNAVGIFTERDLIKRILVPETSLQTEVKKVMSSPLITHDFGIGGRQAAEIMISNGIKRLPLLREGRLAGVVTARDLVEAFAGIH